MASGMCAHELVVFCARVCVCVSAQLCDFTSSVGECIVGCTHTHTHRNETPHGWQSTCQHTVTKLHTHQETQETARRASHPSCAALPTPRSWRPRQVRPVQCVRQVQRVRAHVEAKRRGGEARQKGGRKREGGRRKEERGVKGERGKQKERYMCARTHPLTHSHAYTDQHRHRCDCTSDSLALTQMSTSCSSSCNTRSKEGSNPRANCLLRMKQGEATTAPSPPPPAAALQNKTRKKAETAHRAVWKNEFVKRLQVLEHVQCVPRSNANCCAR